MFGLCAFNGQMYSHDRHWANSVHFEYIRFSGAPIHLISWEHQLYAVETTLVQFVD